MSVSEEGSLGAPRRLGELVELWRRPAGWRLSAAIVVLAGLTVLCALLVYHTGGTRFAWPHVAYIPVVLGAALFGLPGGLVLGLVMGVALGPVMPLDTATGEMQPMASWIARMGFFGLIGTVVGAFSSILNAHVTTLRERSTTDPRTGLKNRNYLIEHSQRAVNQRLVTTLICIDLDCHAEVDGTLGIRALDSLVGCVGDSLRSVLPPGVEPVRILEDKIAILLPGVSQPDMGRLLERLDEKLQGPFEAESVPVRVGGAIGLAEYPTHATDSLGLFRAARRAMEHAQETGRAVVIYNDSLKSGDEEVLRLLHDVAVALRDGDQMALVYQPKIDLTSGAMVGVEALMRWDHPEMGSVGPDRFIPLIEKSALIHYATEWLIDRSVAQWARWREVVENPPSIAVNVSAKSLLFPGLVEQIRAALCRYDAPVECLEIEVTETAFMLSPAEVVENLGCLRDMGLAVWIDDFGTGYASLNYLRIPPVSGIKIDKTFVADILDDPKDMTLVRGTVSVGRELGLKVLAEGVEAASVARRLMEFGCEQAQGYHFSRPVPAEEIARVLSAD